LKEETVHAWLRKAALLFLLVLTLPCACHGLRRPFDSQDSESPDAITIRDIQQGEVGAGTTVALHDVVLTSGFTAARQGFFVQDEGGGPQSGIYVYTAGPLDSYEPASGDQVDLTATVEQDDDLTGLSVAHDGTIHVTGTGEPVANVLGQGGVTDWEPWEGCLVTLPDQSVASGVNAFGEAVLSAGVFIDNLFIDFVVSSGDVLGSVTGPIFSSDGTYRIEPRDSSDIETSGTVDTVSVHDVQDGSVPTGNPARVDGVVACSGLTLDGTGFYVQDPGGGAYSGVFVYLRDGMEVAVFEGAIADILGTVQEQSDLTVLSARFDDVLLTGDTAACQPFVLDAVPTDLEPFEGVAIGLGDLQVAASGEDGRVETNWGIDLDPALFSFHLFPGQSFSMVYGLLTSSDGRWALCPRSETDFVAPVKAPVEQWTKAISPSLKLWSP
jgi:hypothetical protein